MHPRREPKAINQQMQGSLVDAHACCTCQIRQQRTRYCGVSLCPEERSTGRQVPGPQPKAAMRDMPLSS